jgi:hypothetical protein
MDMLGLAFRGILVVVLCHHSASAAKRLIDEMKAFAPKLVRQNVGWDAPGAS